MSPEYTPGTYIVLRQIPEWEHFLEYGHDYLVILEDKRHLFRQIQAGTDENCLRLISFNPQFGECEIKKDLIHSIWIAKAFYKFNTM